jgi:putative ribosome biogenesis GTPase RsgA
LTLTYFFISTASFAHGTDQHVLGTVTAIDATHVEVKTQKGKTVAVQVNKQTRFKEKGNPKGANLPVVGDRVVIEATKDDKTLLATEIHFSAATRVPAPVQPVPVQ